MKVVSGDICFLSCQFYCTYETSEYSVCVCVCVCVLYQRKSCYIDLMHLLRKLQNITFGQDGGGSRGKVAVIRSSSMEISTFIQDIINE